MRIIPNSNIAIDGRHCPAGEAIEVTDHLGRELIAQGIARRAPDQADVRNTNIAPEPVEQAAVAPVAEQAVPRRAGRSRITAPRL